MPIVGEATPLTMARLKVAFFKDQADLEHLSVYDEQGRSLDYALFSGRFKVAPIRAPTYRPQQLADYELGDMISLVGYDLPDELRTAQPLMFTLYWRASGATDRPHTVFVHLVDRQGQLVAQTDAQPVSGNYPTDLWGDNEVISDTHVLALPIDLSGGDYRVLVGLYSVETGQRLLVLDSEDLPMPDNQISLGTVHYRADGAKAR